MAASVQALSRGWDTTSSFPLWNRSKCRCHNLSFSLFAVWISSVQVDQFLASASRVGLILQTSHPCEVGKTSYGTGHNVAMTWTEIKPAVSNCRTLWLQIWLLVAVQVFVSLMHMHFGWIVVISVRDYLHLRLLKKRKEMHVCGCLVVFGFCLHGSAKCLSGS